jgi:hypothetical protein
VPRKGFWKTPKENKKGRAMENKDLMELVNGCGVATAIEVGKIPAAKETANLLNELGFTAAALGIERRLRPAMKREAVAAGGYVEITPEKIVAFLERKAAEYNRNRPKLEKKRGPFNGLAGTLSGQALTQAYSQLRQELSGAQTQVNPAYTTTGPAWGLANYGQAVYMSNFSDLASFSTTASEAQAQPKYRSPEHFEAATEDHSTTREGTIGKFRWTESPVEQYAGIPPLNVLHKFKDEKAKNVFDYFTIASVNAVRDPLLLGRIEDSSNRYFIAQWGDDVSLDDVI